MAASVRAGRARRSDWHGSVNCILTKRLTSSSLVALCPQTLDGPPRCSRRSQSVTLLATTWDSRIQDAQQRMQGHESPKQEHDVQKWEGIQLDLRIESSTQSHTARGGRAHLIQTLKWSPHLSARKLWNLKQAAKITRTDQSLRVSRKAPRRWARTTASHSVRLARCAISGIVSPKRHICLGSGQDVSSTLRNHTGARTDGGDCM